MFLRNVRRNRSGMRDTLWSGEPVLPRMTTELGSVVPPWDEGSHYFRYKSAVSVVYRETIVVGKTYGMIKLVNTS